MISKIFRRYERMTAWHISGLAALAGAVVILNGCSKQAAEPAAGAPAPKEAAEPESRVKRGSNGETIVTLDAATQKTMGLEVTNLISAQVSPVVKAYGRVLDPSPLAALVADLATAQAADHASQAELKRFRTLAAQTNASDRALQTAEATAIHDQAQLEATRLKLLANWGNEISSRPGLATLVQELSSLSAVLVELDLPAGDHLEANPTGARLYTLGNANNAIEAQYIGPSPLVDPQMQGHGFLFLVETNTARLAPGAALTGMIVLPGEGQSGLSVPREAVIRYNGTTWVYRQTSAETFERFEVALEQPLASGWFVRQGLKPDDKVVSVGAQQMLSEELKGAGGE